MATVEELQKALEARRKAAPAKEMAKNAADESKALMDRLRSEIEAAKKSREMGPEHFQTPANSAFETVMPKEEPKAEAPREEPVKPAPPAPLPVPKEEPKPSVAVRPDTENIEYPIVERVDLSGAHFLTTAEKRVVEKIRLALHRGISQDVIRAALKKDGFNDHEIDRYMKNAFSSEGHGP